MWSKCSSIAVAHISCSFRAVISENIFCPSAYQMNTAFEPSFVLQVQGCMRK